MPFVIKSGKSHLDLFHEFRKARPLFAKKGDVAWGKIFFFPILFFKSFLDLSIVKIRIRQHPHQEVKAVSHTGKTDDFSNVHH